MTIHRTTHFLALVLLVLPLSLAACGVGSNEATPSPTAPGIFAIADQAQTRSLLAAAGLDGGGQTTEVSGGGGVAASCAMLVSYDGHDYLGTSVEAKVVPGDSLGTGTIPPCNDTGDAGTTIPAEQVEVTAVQGVPPTVAIMLAGRDDVVLVRDDVTKLPKELQSR